MSRTRPQHILDWITIILDFRNKGILDPSYFEIAQIYFGAKIIATLRAQPIKDDLRTLLTILRYDHGFELTHCVGWGWYYPPEKREHSFRQVPPQNEKECQWCVPMKTGKNGGRWGIRFAHSKDDLLWHVMNEFHGKTSGCSWKHHADRKALGIKAKLIGKKIARKAIKTQVQNLAPGNFKSFGDLGWNGDPNPFDYRGQK